MKVILQILAWLLTLATTFATVGPPRFRPETDLPHDFEHALAFIVVGMAFGAAYPRHRGLVVPISVVVIGLIEVAQLWAPGRHARLEDFIVNVLTFWAGLAVAAILGWTVARMRPATAISR